MGTAFRTRPSYDTRVVSTTTREGITLLACIPGPLGRHTPLFVLQERIEHANKIMLYIFETACIVLREPSFNRIHFRGVLESFLSVVQERIEQAERLVNQWSISDEDIYRIFWANTLQMLLTVEERGLSPGHENLSLNTVGGVLNSSGCAHIDLKNEGPGTLRFIDELAKARDELWRNHRLSTHPAAAALAAPFPRSLPLQPLTEPYISYMRDGVSKTPYIASRIKAAVFPEQKTALAPYPENEEMREAIGIFVDDYLFALKMYTAKWLDKEEQRGRVHAAWTYAVGPLSEGRLTWEEAYRYWTTGETWYAEFPAYWHRVSDAESLDWSLVPGAERPDEVEG